jgi:hypothetical protein
MSSVNKAEDPGHLVRWIYGEVFLLPPATEVRGGVDLHSKIYFQRETLSKAVRPGALPRLWSFVRDKSGKDVVVAARC